MKKQDQNTTLSEQIYNLIESRRNGGKNRYPLQTYTLLIILAGFLYATFDIFENS